MKTERVTPEVTNGGVAQLVERHVCNAEVDGSSPCTSTVCILFCWRGRLDTLINAHAGPHAVEHGQRIV